jgi:hypothetical protein
MIIIISKNGNNSYKRVSLSLSGWAIHEKPVATVQSASITIKNGIYVRELESGSCFGENVILYANSKRITSVIAMEKVVRCIKFLGRGKFDFVSLVHNKKNIYAIKAISRKSVESQKNVSKIFCE